MTGNEQTGDAEQAGGVCALLPNESDETCLTQGSGRDRACDHCRARGWPTGDAEQAGELSDNEKAALVERARTFGHDGPHTVASDFFPTIERILAARAAAAPGADAVRALDEVERLCDAEMDHAPAFVAAYKSGERCASGDCDHEYDYECGSDSVRAFVREVRAAAATGGGSE